MNATKVRRRRASPSAPPPVSLTHQIDRVDKAILRLLQRDASISNVALAAKVHLSPPACLRRVERLKRAGLINATVALLNARALGVQIDLAAQMRTQPLQRLDGRGAEGQRMAWKALQVHGDGS